MGFVSGGANGPAQETARNTARTADVVTQVRDALVRMSAKDADTWAATNNLMNDAG
jgi:hypothetical protein